MICRCFLQSGKWRECSFFFLSGKHRCLWPSGIMVTLVKNGHDIVLQFLFPWAPIKSRLEAVLTCTEFLCRRDLWKYACGASGAHVHIRCTCVILQGTVVLSCIKLPDLALQDVLSHIRDLIWSTPYDLFPQSWNISSVAGAHVPEQETHRDGGDTTSH